MGRLNNDEQFKFLISCIRWSNNGKVDFDEVATECEIVSKGAAAKRYERMMKAHGIHQPSNTARDTAVPPMRKKEAKDIDEAPTSKKRKTTEADNTSGTKTKKEKTKKGKEIKGETVDWDTGSEQVVKDEQPMASDFPWMVYRAAESTEPVGDSSFDDLFPSNQFTAINGPRHGSLGYEHKPGAFGQDEHQDEHLEGQGVADE